ncbi:hypothetical protein FEM48_Zijuj03G0103200 [Ziziphus jujuba var. spinosa]|uniref:Pentatricopeptide repeat-containing protein n=1 Tax=Ziziphus jujuba var. spinosa TaxID=714518 RepID=A0A978VPQ8_ZIZJJ|nr:hypothetical protein FEM48_Zijuj03G0103200 [Ziziphus jujuba var. spinosa]
MISLQSNQIWLFSNLLPFSRPHRHSSVSHGTKHSFHSVFSPKASISFSTTQNPHQRDSLTLPNDAIRLPSLLEEINKLCESGNLIEALNSLQEDSHNAASSSEGRAEAMGVLLQACGRHKDIDTGRKVHEIVSSSTQFSNHFVLNTRLITMYSMCEEVELESLKELHGYSMRHGFHYDELVANAFIAAYAKCGSLSYAENVFYGIDIKTVSTWNALIGGFAQNGDPRKALDFYFKMKYAGLDPDSFSIGSLLLACSYLKVLKYGKEIHGFV